MKLRIVGLVLAAATLQGCAFTQWTDHAYLGSADCPPSHPNREWAFAAIVPAAVIGDIITAPVQSIALLIGGDESLYAPTPCTQAWVRRDELAASRQPR